MNLGNKINNPNWSIPKGPRKSSEDRWQLNQSYDKFSSIGSQLRSDKTSRPQFSIGKEKRGQNKSGIFAAHMEYKPASVRMNHPGF